MDVPIINVTVNIKAINRPRDFSCACVDEVKLGCSRIKSTQSSKKKDKKAQMRLNIQKIKYSEDVNKKHYKCKNL